MRVHDVSGPLDHGKGGWCPDCHLAWTEGQAAHCSGCCRHFSSDSAFDGHHVLDPKTRKSICRDPATLTTRSGKAKFVDRDGVWGAPSPDGGWPRVTDPPAEASAAGIGPTVSRQTALEIGGRP